MNAVLRAVQRLHEDLLVPARSQSWLEAEFHRERVTYWALHCAMSRKGSHARPVAPVTHVMLSANQDPWFEGTIASYTVGSGRRPDRQLATSGDQDPHSLAQRHRMSKGTLVRGRALFATLPHETTWTPSTWPDSFAALEGLLDRITGETRLLARWLEKRDRRRKSKVTATQAPTGGRAGPQMVILLERGALFAYQVFPGMKGGLLSSTLQPVAAQRVDASWCLARDHEIAKLEERRRRRVLLLGCGSLGSPVVEMLARAGVGTLEIVDPETLDAANTSRHLLGLSSEGFGKAYSMKARLEEAIPSAEIRHSSLTAAEWVANHCSPGKYDVVVDCTGESSVRTMLAMTRETALGRAPIVHAWLEPFCAAAHVVLTQPDQPWPTDDPYHLVNATDFSNTETLVRPPACAQGFHPYGVADAWQAAGFAAERILSVVDELEHPSTVWSWIRSRAFHEALPVKARLNAVVPRSGSRHDSVMISRTYSEVFGL